MPKDYRWMEAFMISWQNHDQLVVMAMRTRRKKNNRKISKKYYNHNVKFIKIIEEFIKLRFKSSETNNK